MNGIGGNPVPLQAHGLDKVGAGVNGQTNGIFFLKGCRKAPTTGSLGQGSMNTHMHTQTLRITYATSLFLSPQQDLFAQQLLSFFCSVIFSRTSKENPDWIASLLYCGFLEKSSCGSYHNLTVGNICNGTLSTRGSTWTLQPARTSASTDLVVLTFATLVTGREPRSQFT